MIRERIFVWFVLEASSDGRRWFQVERTLVDALTGEVMDTVQGRTDPPAAGGALPLDEGAVVDRGRRRG